MEERKIDLLDMIADILSHWRGLLVALIIGAILMGGFSYVKSYRNVQSEQEAEEEPELDEMSVEEQLAQLEDSLSDSEKISVAATVDDEREYLYKDTYYRESIYMHLDPLNIARTELVYRIQAEDGSLAQRLGTVYKNIVGGVGVYDWVEQQAGIPAEYAAELISVSTDPAIFVGNGAQNISIGSDSLKVTVMQKDEKTCEQLAEAVNSYMEEQQKNLAEKLGSHELILLSETSGKIISTDTMVRQIDYGNQLINLKAGIASAKAGFTEDQQKYYDLLTWEEKAKEAEMDHKDAATEEEPVLESPSVGKKYVLLGAVLFAFVYAGILFLLYIFNSKIRVSDELQNLYHIPQIGVVVKDSKKKFILDKWVDDLRHYGKRKFDAKQSMELAFAAVKNKLNTICLMGCNLEAGAGSVCENLKTALEKEGINVTVLDNVLYNAESMEKVDTMTGVVLVEKAGSTLYNEIANELALLKRQDIAILGGIIVE